MNFISNSSQETEQAGKKLAAKLKGGDILLLSGELGAGKTSLVKGIAKGLGIKNNIASPTFALMNVYPVKSPPSGVATGEFNRVKSLIHIDTYRLKDEKELVEIGVEDYLGQPNTICAVEWPEKISSLLKNISFPHRTFTLRLKHGVKDGQRQVLISEV